MRVPVNITALVCSLVIASLNLNLLLPEEGVLRDPCKGIYCGHSAGSEPETRAVSAELNRIAASVIATVSLHSFRKAFAMPWGNHVNFLGPLCDRTEDHDELVCAL